MVELKGEERKMLRAMLSLFVALFLLTTALPSASSADQDTSVVPLKSAAVFLPKSLAPDMTPIHRVADPYCPGGTSSCGQDGCVTFLGRISCKPWEVCCYPQRGPGSCVRTDKCLR